MGSVTLDEIKQGMEKYDLAVRNGPLYDSHLWEVQDNAPDWIRYLLARLAAAEKLAEAVRGLVYNLETAMGDEDCSIPNDLLERFRHWMREARAALAEYEEPAR